jgi:N-glycosylase/DNA lyase
MTLAPLGAANFDLRGSIESGQIFHAMARPDGWQVLIDRTPIHVEQRADGLWVSKGHEALASSYFSLDHPLEEIYSTFPSDPFTQAALKACSGLRVFRQPRWECLGTFITSPMKQVTHIRQMSLALRERFGEAVAGSDVPAYPTPARLAAATEEELRACGLGFRAKSLLGTARAVADGSVDLEAIAKLSTNDARDALCQCPGVGRKVANCVLLFAYERLDAVPVDVWIARVTRAMKPRSGKATNLDLEKYAKRFGAYAGYVQQYLFQYARTSGTLPAR